MNQQIVQEVESLDIFQKAKVYMDYKVTLLGLKHNFVWYNKPEYLWKDIKSEDFEKFISPSNIVVSDMGDDWEVRGYAEKIRTDYRGIYDWWWKFKDRIHWQ